MFITSIERESVSAIQADDKVLGVPSWIENPHSVVDWWTMEQFAAETFFKIGSFLQIAIDAVDKGSYNLGVLRPTLDHVEQECEKVGLRIALRAVESAKTACSASAPVLSQALATLNSTIRWEMGEHVFMHIPTARAERYDQPQGFGSAVAAAFPSAKFDIWESGNCYAAGRYTACVFHLMRSLEDGLGVLAKIFNVPSDHTNWHNIIQQLESKIRDMGNDPAKPSNWKIKQEFYSQAANSFMFFKDAWRNYTAHARGKYVEHEADTIYRNVCAFMQKLADGGLHE